MQKNLQGDVVQIVNASNGVVGMYEYDAWGNVVAVVDANGNAITSAANFANINPIRYRTYYYDTETGFYYLGSRYYDPANCRFISPDTTDVLTAMSESATDKNLFAYCDNNPIMRVDHGGQLWHMAIGTAIGGIIGGVSSALSGGDIVDVIIGTVSGAASGLLAASGAGCAVQAIAGAGISMASNATSQLKSIATNNSDTFNVVDILFDGAVGGVCGFAGGNGASCGNTAGIKAAGKQLTKRILSGDNIRKAVSYYSKVAHRQGGGYVMKELGSSLSKSAFGAGVTTLKNRLRGVVRCRT